jgi:hypothetical protein
MLSLNCLCVHIFSRLKMNSQIVSSRVCTDVCSFVNCSSNETGLGLVSVLHGMVQPFGGGH